MLKQLAAIALNLLLMSSPAMALMADELDGFTDSPKDESEIAIAVSIDAAFADENCYGQGVYRLYRPDMAVTIRTTDGKVYDSVHPFSVDRDIYGTRLRCVYYAFLKIPNGDPFYLSLAGVAIPGKLYDIVEGKNGDGFFSLVSDVNLIDLIRLSGD